MGLDTGRHGWQASRARRHWLALLSCSRSADVEREPLQLAPLRLGFIGTGEAQPVGPEGFAFERGDLTPQLQQLGFRKPEFVRFANGPDLNEALSGDSIDLGIYGDTPAIVGRAAGLPTRLVNQTVVGMDAWLLAPPGGVSAVRELAGKVVATSKGSYMHRYLAGLLQDQGLSGKVTLVHLLPAEAQAALERGDVAAYASPASTAPLLVSKGAKVIDRASDHAGSSGAPSPSSRTPSCESIRRFLPLTALPSEPLSPPGRALLEGAKRFLVAQGLAQGDFDFDLDAWTVPVESPR